MIEKAEKSWSWNINLYNLFGKTVKVETKDGIYLSGVLSGEERSFFEMDDTIVSSIITLELDNDKEKVVDVSRIKKLVVLD